MKNFKLLFLTIFTVSSSFAMETPKKESVYKKLYDTLCNGCTITCENEQKQESQITCPPLPPSIVNTIFLKAFAQIKRNKFRLLRQVPIPYAKISNPNAEINCIKYSPDGTELSHNNNKTNHLIVRRKNNENIWSEYQTLNDHTDSVRCLAYKPDGLELASGGDDKKIIIRKKNDEDLWEQEQILEEHSDWVNCLAYNSDGSELASGGDDKKLIIRRKNDNHIWQAVQTIEEHKSIWRLLYVLNDSELVNITDSQNSSYSDVLTKKKDKQGTWYKFAGFTLASFVWDLDFNAHHAELAYNLCNEITIRKKDIFTVYNGSWKQIQNIKKNDKSAFYDYIRCLTYSPDGTELIGGGVEEKKLVIRKKHINGKWKRTQTLEGHTQEILSLAMHPDGSELASADKTGTIFIWDMKKFNEFKKLLE